MVITQEMIDSHKKWLDGNEFGVQLNINNEKIEKCILQGVNLSGCNFINCDLSDVTFYKCKLNNINFKDCIFNSTKIEFCTLENTTFDGGNVENIFFNKTDVSNCNFINNNVKKIDTNTKHKIFFIGDQIMCGCIKMPISQWIERSRKISQLNGYSEEELLEARNLVLKEIYKKNS